jgi:hypothetical protein
MVGAELTFVVSQGLPQLPRAACARRGLTGRGQVSLRSTDWLATLTVRVALV